MTTKRILFSIVLIFAVGIVYSQQLPDTLRVGIIKYKTTEKLLATYTPMMDYISEQIGIPVSLSIAQDDQLGYDLVHGKYHIGIFKPFPYLQSKVDFPQLEVFASHLVNGNSYYEGLIITKKTSDIESLPQLKDKQFLFIKPTSTSGFRFPKGIFKEYDIDIDDGFFNYDFSYGHSEAIDALAKDQVDGIAVSLSAFMKQDSVTFEQVNVLSEYKVPHHAYSLSPQLDSLLSERIKTIMFDAHKTPSGREIFDNPLGISKWEPQTDDYYNYLRRYLRIMRVKPTIQVNLTLKESAKNALAEQGDLIDIIKDNLYNELLSSQRFSKPIEGTSTSDQVSVIISKIKNKDYHYQIYLNNERTAESDILEEELIDLLPKLTTASVLIHSPIETELLSNEERTFITFGKNDGLNMENYLFYAVDKDGKEEQLKVVSISELNTYFDLSEVSENTKLIAKYVTDEYKESQVSVLEQLKTDNFWKDSFWDKIGLIGGIVVAVVSAIFGWFLNSKKKRRFKRMLSETNTLLKSYYEDKIKLDQRLDELKDIISAELHKGNITENQFLILKHKLDEVEANVRNKKPSETNEEIDNILKNSGISPTKE